MKMKNHHAIIVGIGQRTEDSRTMTITSKDAKRVAFELGERCNIPKENISLLVDKNATKKNILNELDELIAKTLNKKAEMIWIYFSGHGSRHPNEIENNFFFICNDTKKAHIEKTAISGTDFASKLDQIDSEKVLLLLDCCHSGGAIDSRINIPFKTKSLKNTSNRIVIAASHAEEFAFISNPLSVFTYALIEGLSGKYFKKTDKHVTILDLAMYIRERVHPLSKRQQSPQIHAIDDKATHNFILVSYPDGKPSKPAFDEDFTLSDGKGKLIDTNIEIIKDNDYRDSFEWLLLNPNSVVNNGVVLIETQEINSYKTSFDKAGKVIVYNQDIKVYNQEGKERHKEDKVYYFNISDVEHIIDSETVTKKILIFVIRSIIVLGLFILAVGVINNQSSTLLGGILVLMCSIIPGYPTIVSILPRIRECDSFARKHYSGTLNRNEIEQMVEIIWEYKRLKILGK